MAVDHYLVYLLTAVVAGITRYYYGITGVLTGQSDEGALKVRRGFHEKWQKRWLKGMREMRMATVVTDLGREHALIEEARLTARKYLEVGGECVRGGPWCRMTLPRSDKNEIIAVAACASRAAVKALAADSPGKSLSLHLAGRSYSTRAAMAPPPAMLPCVTMAKPPLVITCRPRQSTRYRLGVQRASGKHRVGKWRPSSGKSGSQSSGAERRFNALRLPMKRRA